LLILSVEQRTVTPSEISIQTPDIRTISLLNVREVNLTIAYETLKKVKCVTLNVIMKIVGVTSTFVLVLSGNQLAF